MCGIKIKLTSYLCHFIILLLVSLLFVAVSNPYFFFKFKIFVLNNSHLIANPKIFILFAFTCYK